MANSAKEKEKQRREREKRRKQQLHLQRRQRMAPFREHWISWVGAAMGVLAVVVDAVGVRERVVVGLVGGWLFLLPVCRHVPWVSDARPRKVAFNLALALIGACIGWCVWPPDVTVTPQLLVVNSKDWVKVVEVVITNNTRSPIVAQVLMVPSSRNVDLTCELAEEPSPSSEIYFGGGSMDSRFLSFHYTNGTYGVISPNLGPGLSRRFKLEANLKQDGDPETIMITASDNGIRPDDAVIRRRGSRSK